MSGNAVNEIITEEKKERARKQAKEMLKQHYQIQVNHIKAILERHRNRPDLAMERIYKYLEVE
jgi:hypothetical protein